MLSRLKKGRGEGKAYKVSLWSLDITAGSHLMDFKPVAITAVLTHIARGFGHVDGQRSGVLHRGIVPQLEAESVAGHDLCDLCAAGVGERARVAAEVVAGRDELLGRHDAVAVLTNVLKIVGQTSVDEQLAEAVVGLGRVGRGESPEGETGEAELHVEKKG